MEYEVELTVEKEICYKLKFFEEDGSEVEDEKLLWHLACFVVDGSDTTRQLENFENFMFKEKTYRCEAREIYMTDEDEIVDYRFFQKKSLIQ